MDDKNFKALKRLIEQETEELAYLQKLYFKETGVYYNTGLSLKQNADIDRKDKLLKDALEQLLACEWEVSQGIIAEIEAELT